ncbi:hypothetical protein JOD24_002750 [Kroppenstedtia sanguinis]
MILEMFDIILIIIGISLILVVIGVISILIIPVKYFWISLLIWGLLSIYLLVKYAGKK